MSDMTIQGIARHTIQTNEKFCRDIDVAGNGQAASRHTLYNMEDTFAGLDGCGAWGELRRTQPVIAAFAGTTAVCGAAGAAGGVVLGNLAILPVDFLLGRGPTAVSHRWPWESPDAASQSALRPLSSMMRLGLVGKVGGVLSGWAIQLGARLGCAGAVEKGLRVADVGVAALRTVPMATTWGCAIVGAWLGTLAGATLGVFSACFAALEYGTVPQRQFQQA